MTAQSTNGLLTKLHSATSDLAGLARTATTFQGYVEKATAALIKQFSQLSVYTVETVTANLAQPKLNSVASFISDPPSNASHFAILPFDNDDIKLAVEIALPDQQLWEVIPLWHVTVNQVWQAKTSDLNLARQIELYKRVAKATSQINQELIIGHAMNSTCRSIVEAIEMVEHAGIVINDNYPESGTVVAEYPDTRSVGVSITLKGYPLNEKMETTLKPVAVNDVENAEEILGINYETIKGVGIKSLLIVPLVVENRVIGSIGLDINSQKHTFTEAEIEIMQGIATQISIGIHNAELFEELSARIVSEAITTQVSARLPLRSDLNSLLQIAATEIGIVVGAKKVKVHLNPEFLKRDDLGDTQS